MFPLPLFLSFLVAAVVAQDGGISGPTSSAQAANYNCDTSKCQLPNCHCASTSPPGGLNPKEVPMFLVFTADDAVQSYTINAVNSLLSGRKNPNGCAPVISYYTSLNYTNYTLVTDFYVAGNEIADHTMTHVGTPDPSEINGNLIALNALAGIPFSSIKGFRAPFLNISVETLEILAKSGFLYDSSATASLPVTADGTDAFWPYTLDYGLANNCLSLAGACSGKPQLPGLWEVPMYAQFDSKGGVHLMDPWLDGPGETNTPDNAATLEWMKSTFTDHYNNNRQPFGLYTHPIHLASGYPGVPTPTDTINMIKQFIDWAQEQQDVWIISTEQLVAWMQNPVPTSKLNDFAPLKCSTPQVDQKICNGVPGLEEGLLSHCAFSDFPYYTCYGCPEVEISPSNPNPPQASGAQMRYRIPKDCQTPFWDPIGNKCVCNSTECKFTDTSGPVTSNGANLTGSSSSASSSASNDPVFNGGALSILPTQAIVSLLLMTAAAIYGGFLVRV